MASKYDRLGEHLAAIGTAAIVLAFEEVEEVVGPLPREARHSSAWWGVGLGRYYAPRTSYTGCAWASWRTGRILSLRPSPSAASRRAVSASMYRRL